VLDRVLGLLALFQVGAIAVCFPTTISRVAEFQIIRVSLWIGAAVGTVLLIIMMIPGSTHWKSVRLFTRLPVVGKIVAELLDDFELYQQRRGVFLQCIGLSLLGHLGMLSIFYIASLTVNDRAEIPNLLSHLQLVPAAELAGVLVPLPGGIGGLEAASDWLYEIAGAEKGQGLAMSLAFRVVMLLVSLAGGIFYFNSRRKVQQVLEEQEEASAINE